MTTEEQDTHKGYTISEACTATGTSQHLLRQWEERFPQLRPRRSRTGNRIYSQRDLEIIRRIKTLVQHEGMTTRGARAQLSRELHEVGRPRNTHEMVDMLDRIADEARAIISLFDEDEAETAEE